MAQQSLDHGAKRGPIGRAVGVADVLSHHKSHRSAQGNYDDGDSYNFTVETPFSDYTGRTGQSTRQSTRYDDSTASSQSSRQSSRYDDSTASGRSSKESSRYDDSTTSGNTYADDSYASSQSRPSARDRARPS